MEYKKRTESTERKKNWIDSNVVLVQFLFPLSEWFECGVRILQFFFLSLLLLLFTCANDQMKTIQVAVSACVITFEKYCTLSTFLFHFAHTQRMRLKINWWKNGKGIYNILFNLWNSRHLFVCLTMLCVLVCVSVRLNVWRTHFHKKCERRK